MRVGYNYEYNSTLNNLCHYLSSEAIYVSVYADTGDQFQRVNLEHSNDHTSGGRGSSSHSGLRGSTSLDGLYLHSLEVVCPQEVSEKMTSFRELDF